MYTLIIEGTYTYYDSCRDAKGIVNGTAVLVGLFISPARVWRAFLAAKDQLNGNAKLNGDTGYTFRVTACDVAEPGIGKDTFNIDVSGPNSFRYHNAGTITDGNIQAH